MRGIPKQLLSFVPPGHAFTALTRIIFGKVGAILMFHEVQDNPDGELRTGCLPSVLDGLIRGLLSRGWDIVSLDEALRRIKNGTGRRFVVLTFDDGYRDTFDFARIVLEKYSAPFTVYIPTGTVTRELNAWWLGLREIFRGNDVVRIDGLQRTFYCSDLPSRIRALRQACAWVARDFSVVPTLCDTFRRYHVCMEQLVDRYFLDVNGLKCLAQNSLVTVGAHTSSHQALSVLSAHEMSRELCDNRAFLQCLLDVEVGHLAYPYGTPQACGEREFSASSSLGFISAVTSERRHLDRRGLRFHALPRIDVTGASWADVCTGIDSAEFGPVACLPEPSKGPAATAVM